MKGRSLGIMRRPGLLALLAFGAGGCPEDPEPASTAPPCKSGDCPVDVPAPDDPSIAATAPAEQLRGASVTTIHVDEASRRPAPLVTGNTPSSDPVRTP